MSSRALAFECQKGRKYPHQNILAFVLLALAAGLAAARGAAARHKMCHYQRALVLVAVELRPEGAGQDLGNGGADIGALVDDAVHGERDRHVHAVPGRQFDN